MARHLVRGAVDHTARTLAPLLERLTAVGLIQSAVILAAQTFMALFPLLIALIAIGPPTFGTTILDTLRDRIGITGDTREMTQRLIASRSELRSGLSVFGVILVLASATSFTRALQRVYEGAWQLPRTGLRGSIRGLAWLAGFVVYVALLAMAIRLTTFADEAGTMVRPVIAALAAAMLWWWTPYVLLGGRVRARALLLTGMLTAIGLAVLGWLSAIYMPRTVHNQEQQYGTIGVVFAIQSWLVVVAAVIVSAAVVGAVANQATGPIGRLARGSPDPAAWRRDTAADAPP